MTAIRHSWLAASLAASVIMTGCSTYVDRSEEDYLPLELTFLQIYQSVSAGVLDPSYVGTLRFPNCSQNTNDFIVRINGGSEVYQIVPGVEGSTLRLVAERRPELPGTDLDPGQSYGTGVAASHLVFANETATGGHNYSIHIYDFIMDPGSEGLWKNWTPVQRQDYWHNVTFTPFGSDTLYEEGQREGDGWRCSGTRPSDGD